MSEQDNAAVVRRAYENFRGGDISALLGQLADDVDWRLPEIEGASFSGARVGRESVGGFFTQLADTQEVLSFEPREFVAEGDKVVALGTYRWRVKQTGREYGGDWAHVFTVRDGRIAGFQEYMDSAAAPAPTFSTQPSLLKHAQVALADDLPAGVGAAPAQLL